MACKRLTLLGLPDDILISIFTHLLQHTVEAVPNPIRKDLDLNSYAGFCFGPEPLHPLQTQLLRVCKRFNAVGASLLYANTLVFQVNCLQGYLDQQSIDRVSSYLEKLAYSRRDNAPRLTKIRLLLYPPEISN